MTTPADSYIEPEKFNEFHRQEEAPVAGQPKLVVFGNSLTLHGPSSEIGWLGNHGMAASCQAVDFVHLLMSAMGIASDETIIENCADLERLNASGSKIEARTRDILALGPEVCIIQLGDNVLTESQLSAFSRNLDHLVNTTTLTAGRTLLLSTWWGTAAQDLVIAGCAMRYGVDFIYIGDIYPSAENLDRKYRRFEHAGVHAHPGDWGMRKIAERLLERLTTKLPTAQD